MKIILTQIKRASVTLILVGILLPIATPKANAGVLDWFNGTQSASQSPVPVQDSAYLTANSIIDTSPNTSSNNEETVLINDSFLLAKKTSSKNLVLSHSEKFASFVVGELIVSITAYSSTFDQTDSSPFITARGTYVRDGIVAANFLPFGTKIKIPSMFGDKIFVVEDRMNKRYWQKVDIWFPDRESALEFGSRTLKIQILES